MKRVKWPVRATPSCPTFPYGVKEELIEVEYEPHEAGMLAALGTRLHDPDPEVQREGMNEILVLHELKALTGARVLTEGDMIERGIEPLQVPAGYLPGTSQGTSQVHEDPIQTTMIPPEGTESLLFRIPPTARKKLGMVEPDNVGYVPVEEPLSDPDKKDIGKFHAPTSDAPDTERLAALSVYPRSGTQRRAVLDAIASAGERGLIDEEIAERLGMLANTERPRRVELEQGGWVVNSGRTRKTAASGTEAAVWVLSAQGRAEWRESA